MHCVILITILAAATSVSIVEPVDGETYNGDWLPFRVIVENENQIPDSVHYTLNGNPVIQIPRLNTDWPTYMQNYQNRGFSESPAPMDNTVLWTAPVTGYEHEFPTPVVVNGIVYYPSNYGTDSLYALNSATGELIWKFRTGYTDDAVTVYDGRVYTPSDSLWCLDALTGERIWAFGGASADGGSPIVLDGKVYCGKKGDTEGTVFCLDAEDGTVIWSTPLTGGTPASCMAITAGALFVATSGDFVPPGGLYALDISDGSILWMNSESYEGYWDSSPVIVDDWIYICDYEGYARAINSTTGETEWATPITVGEKYIAATPVLAYNRMFFGDQVSSIHCLNPADGAFIWSTPGVIHHGSSGVADGVLFFGERLILPWDYSSLEYDSACVRAFDCLTGIEIWNYKTPCSQYMGHQSSPSISDGVMYYACTDGFLYAFGTGLKYTYKEDYFYAYVGSNELIVTSWDDGIPVAADTISFTVTQTGISLGATSQLSLCAVPNPARTSSTISFSLSEPGMVSLRIYDLAGREITSLTNHQYGSGEHSLQWNCNGSDGQSVSSGLYICRIESGGIVETTGLCVLR